MKYLSIDFVIEFSRSLKFTTSPVFVFRSILGKELRKMSCMFKDRLCKDCSINQNCAYVKLFESHITKDTGVLKGRNRVSHPFLLYTEVLFNSLQTELVLHLTLIGDGIEYLSYFYYAVSKAGEHGIFKSRTPFIIKDVLLKGNSIIAADGSIDSNVSPDVWSFQSNMEPANIKRVRINFLSPLRLKIQGKYVSNFGYDDLIRACFRRLEILEIFYGDNSGMELNYENIAPKKVSLNTHWVDQTYYSARQKSSMKLGGVTGSMEIEGSFSDLEISLLKGGEMFHVGKNTGFGLGKIELKIEEN